jgi:predicted metal-dependent HD superfamily phosphohydrolase
MLEGLLARHREPHRQYHTAVHVMWVCRHIDALVGVHPVDDVPSVLAAALFHDAVYEPRSSTNEADSAALADARLVELDWSPERRAAVAAMILATAGHLTEPAIDDRPVDGTAVLLDADLAILGASAAEYAAYATAVRAEYTYVDDSAWRSGRAAVLQSFLDHATIYRTPTMRGEREHRARANITAELAQLLD